MLRPTRIRELTMCDVKNSVQTIKWEELDNFIGNRSIPSVEKLIEQSFNTGLNIKIEDEDRVWKKSEMSLLLDHIQERKSEESHK